MQAQMEDIDFDMILGALPADVNTFTGLVNQGNQPGMIGGAPPTHRRRSSGNAITSRLRAASDLHQQGVISEDDKALMKSLIVSRDPAFREACANAEAQGDWGKLRELLHSGQFNNNNTNPTNQPMPPNSHHGGLAAALGSFAPDTNAQYHSDVMPDDFAAVFDDLDAEHVYLPFSRRSSALSVNSMTGLSSYDALRRSSAMSTNSMAGGLLSMDAVRRASALSTNKNNPGGIPAFGAFNPNPIPVSKRDKKAAFNQGRAPSSAPAPKRMPKRQQTNNIRSERGAVHPHTGISGPSKNSKSSVGVVAVSPWPAQQKFKKEKGNPAPVNRPDLAGNTPELAKMRKNERERKRRLAVSQGFDHLLKLLDMPTASKMDKACVLHAAIQRITELEHKADDLQNSNQNIRKELGLPQTAPMQVRLLEARKDSAHLHAAAAVAAAVAASHVKPN